MAMGTHAHLRRRLWLLAVTLLGSMALVLPALAGSEGSPTIEGCSGVCWKPTSATVLAGGEVNIINPTTTNHGVEWRPGNPATPSCTGIPESTTSPSFGTGWRGSCVFTVPGKYTFWCTVHGAAMTAVVTVTSGPPAPTIKRVSPKKGPSAGETPVTITGSGFSGATAVTFGAVAATSFMVVSDSSIAAVSPMGAPKTTVNVTVTTQGGTSEITKHDRFKYLAPKRKR
jgi:plastocyanin